jgi:hypothetical protein
MRMTKSGNGGLKLKHPLPIPPPQAGEGVEHRETRGDLPHSRGFTVGHYGGVKQ